MLDHAKRSLLKTIAVTALFAAGTVGASAGDVSSVTNPYSPAYAHGYRHGVVPTRESLRNMNAFDAQRGTTTLLRTSAKTLSFGGGVDGIGVTSSQPKVYLVVYGSQWGTAGTDANGNMTLSGDAHGAVPYMQQLFKGLGTNNETWSGTVTQYCDGALVGTGATSCPTGAPKVGYPSGGSAFAGIWYDNSVASPSQATGAQLAQEAINAAAHFGNTTAASNRYVEYVILSPSGTHPDGFNTSSGQFCAWHDYNGDTTLSGGAVSSPYGDIAFTNMPYVLDMTTSCGENFVNSGTAGVLDGFSIVEGHEYAETVTDQNPAGGWTNQQRRSRYNGEEIGDECAWISPGTAGGSADVSLATGSFAMQSLWSNDTNTCAISHPVL